MSILNNMMHITVTALLIVPGLATAYPILDAVAGLPFPELITVYPDEADPNLYYFVPTTVALVKDPATGKPRLGVQYWGLTGLDPAGRGAALTFSVEPAYDKSKVDAVADGLKKRNPNASFAFPTLVDSSMDVIINDAFVPKSQDTKQAKVKGGTVDATQAFTIRLEDIGARAFAQGVAADSDVLAARYTYKFTGVAKRLHATITVYDKRVYDHFKAKATSSSWWGMVKSSWAADWQKLTTDGAIKITILQGGETDKDAYMLEVFKSIVNAKIGETGMFAPKLKPGGIDVDTGSSTFGWSFSGGAAWEHLEESTNYTFEINTQKLEDREFSAALSFSAVCAKYPDSFADLTTIGKKCIDKAALGDVLKAEQQCLDDKLQHLQGLLQKKLITQAQYDKKAGEYLDAPCYGKNVAVAGAAYAKVPVASAAALSTRTSCQAARLPAIKAELEAGRMSADMLTSVQSLILEVPCGRSDSKDFVVETLHQLEAAKALNSRQLIK